ncbi:MAG: ROK family transcriptional regulator [Gemmatimonadetes bacterium]|nr:ROK family transcriptional regulator [Gemmatimonadota bacterium]
MARHKAIPAVAPRAAQEQFLPPVKARRLTDSALQLIWRERRISRAEIARRASLSRSTVSVIVNELLGTGLVKETGAGQSSGGRRPIMLEFRDRARFILGVDVGATHVAVALTDLRGRVIAWRARDHAVRADPVGTRALIVALCDAALAEVPSSRGRLAGIGVGVPSPVDPANPGRLSEVVLPAWQGQSGLEVLGERYGVPLLIDNDANLAALAEHWWGAGRDVADLAYIKLATGIGLGHILDGEIYRGSRGLAGEIGHLAIDLHGQPCVCGLRGCLVTFVGTKELLARAGELRAAAPASMLPDGPFTIAELEDAALAGDPVALQGIAEAAEHLGLALAGLLNLNNPALVILGGGLVRVGELLLEPLRHAVAARTLVSSARTAIVTSQLGPQAGAVGAATLVLDAALKDPKPFLHH